VVTTWRRLFDAPDTDVVGGKCARLIHLRTLEPRRGGERARCLAFGTTNVCRKRYLSDGCDPQ